MWLLLFPVYVLNSLQRAVVRKLVNSQVTWWWQWSLIMINYVSSCTSEFHLLAIPFFTLTPEKNEKKKPCILFPCNDRIFKSPICFWHLIFVQVFSFYYIFNKCSEHDFTVLKESHWTKSETYFKFLGDEVQKSFYWWQELCDSGQNTQDLFFSSQRQGWDTALR